MFCSSIYTSAEKVLPERFQRAVEYLKKTDFSKVEDGVYEIEGRDIYAKVFTNTSKEREELKAEFHKEYADVQFWISGYEYIGVSYEHHPAADVEAKEEDDVYFLDKVLGEQPIYGSVGEYIILWPEDIHTPGIAVDECITYRKVVIKVRVQ